jgi:hypothetical protein
VLDCASPGSLSDPGGVCAIIPELSTLYDLIEVVPTTLAGVIASMTYINGLADGGYGRIGDQEIVPLLANLAEALEGLAVAS